MYQFEFDTQSAGRRMALHLDVYVSSMRKVTNALLKKLNLKCLLNRPKLVRCVSAITITDGIMSTKEYLVKKFSAVDLMLVV